MKEEKNMGLLERKKYERSVRRRKSRIRIATTCGLILLVTVFVCVFWKPWKRYSWGTSVTNQTDESNKKKSKEEIRKEMMAEAEGLVLCYAYDEAIETLKSIDGYQKQKEIKAKIAEIEAKKAACVPVKLEDIVHICYQPLVVDEEKAFGTGANGKEVSNNQKMTTIDEFKAITEEMYQRGYVMVSIHDLYEVTEDKEGNEVWKEGKIFLPEGKKAFVLTIDDLNYYHASEDYGLNEKLVVDQDGMVVSEYVDAEGETQVGAYECIPIIDQFVAEHPDASYKGAKGLISLTGYNGVFGYRTDVTYDTSNPDCDSEQKAWMAEHPNFDLDKECEEAKKVADALKANGWEFASHTWGHARVADRGIDSLKTDIRKWKENVEPIVGETDVITFAYGQDIATKAGAYAASNEKFEFFKEEGFKIFSNIVTEHTEVFIGDGYLRFGRRNLDGLAIYKATKKTENELSDLFDAKEIYDADRPKMKEM